MMNLHPEDRFDILYRIFSSRRFLSMEGLGKEVPYFIETYDIQQQTEVYRKLGALLQRLETSGIQLLSFGLYDFVIEHFHNAGELLKIYLRWNLQSKKPDSMLS